MLSSYMSQAVDKNGVEVQGENISQLFLTLKISSLDTTNMTAASHSFVVEIAEFQVLNFNS